MIKTTGKEKNYELVEYVNDVNREHTEVLMELNINGIMDTAYSYGNERLTNERFTEWTGYYTYDPRGNVTGVTDAEGMIWQSYRYNANGDFTFGKPQYNNVYSYNAESYNPNMESQYLRARYYNVPNANFLTEDSYLGNITDPLTLNRYNYVKSSPLNYIDPSGHVPVETVVDILSIGWSLSDLVAEPSWSNAGYLIWDVVATVIPYAPGSYTKKGVQIISKADDIADAKRTAKAIDGISDIARTGKKLETVEEAAEALLKNKDEVVMGYKDLKGLAKKLGFTNTNEMISVLLDKDKHQKVTNELRQEIGHVTDILKKGPKTNTASAQEIWDALKKVYKNNDMEQYLQAMFDQIPEAIRAKLCF